MPAAATFALIRPAEVLHRRLVEEGFREGPPRDLTKAAIAIDVEVCREMECPACSAVGLTWQPYHRDLCYRAVAVCECGYGEEV
jgi:hypothetical protein